MRAIKHSKKSRAVHAHGKRRGRWKHVERHPVAPSAGGVMPPDVSVPLAAPAASSLGESPPTSSQDAVEQASAVSLEPSAASTVEDGAPTDEAAAVAMPDSSAGPSNDDVAPRVSTPSWDGLLRKTGLRSDGMRVGWIVAFALLVTLSLAICTREPEATTLSGVPVASTDAGGGSEVHG